ncbi:dGTPase [Serratia rubidaea]|uniref:dGTPase n=1 Tax=Serratia rubidaea TaxID=61652 RepID=UPI00234AD5E9|nr:dGTPase [Serratia rubidaea]MDC6112320.1 dGTPase [Serratia rubidaea]
MSDIDFRNKLSFKRFHGKLYQPKNEYGIVKRFESDRGRIINSAAIRRLQQKTQVFPLERNAAVRSRLTHSLEVQQVGRHIAKEIFHALQQSNKLEDVGLAQLQSVFESIVEMGCLMHDIGNPPFGHFGESAIKDWFEVRMREEDNLPSCLHIDEDSPDLNELRVKVREDLMHFEGNAQAIRLVHSLLQLNLTYAQTACILKYTRAAYQPEKIPGHDYRTKKVGYYMAEEAFVNELCRELSIEKYHRFPLTYIMEAADDISYCIADLEDAFEKGIFSVEQLFGYLQESWREEVGDEGDDRLFEKVIEDAFDDFCSASEYRRNGNIFFQELRVNTIGELVPHAAKRFIDNIDVIFTGKFDEALLEGSCPAYCLLKIFKKVASNYVFNHPEVEQLELQGYRVITGLLDIYERLLKMPLLDFKELISADYHKSYPIETRLLHKLPRKHRLAYIEAIHRRTPLSSDEQEIWEFYFRARLLQDYISGMTDLYAYDEYRRLMAAE